MACLIAVSQEFGQTGQNAPKYSSLFPCSYAQELKQPRSCARVSDLSLWLHLKSDPPNARTSLHVSEVGLCSRRLPKRSPPRSAVPLASVGIICLGLVPTLGGADRPLHWAMSAGIAGFGTLLLVRYRLQRREGALAPVSRAAALRAGRALLWVSGIIALMVSFFTLKQLASGGPVGALSLAMPALGLCWLASLGLKAMRWPSDAIQPPASAEDRPSRRPPRRERLTPPGSTPPGGSGRHASA
jgi:hypothetical protein